MTETIDKEFWLSMIGQPVEIGIYGQTLVETENAPFVASYAGTLASYTVTENFWSFRLQDDPNKYEVDRREYTILISHYTAK